MGRVKGNNALESCRSKYDFLTLANELPIAMI